MTAEFYKGMALGALAMFWLMAVVIVVVGRRAAKDKAPVNLPIVGEQWFLTGRGPQGIATVLSVHDGIVEYHLGELFPHNVLSLAMFQHCYARRTPLINRGIEA